VAQTTAAIVLSRLGGPDPEDVADQGLGAPEEALHDARLREHLRRTLARCCTAEDRELIAAIYDEGLTMTELGARIGRSKSTISRRHAALIARIGQALRAEPGTA
jgi:RNA polymerase sigma factor (sigma-70 family)